MGLKFSLPSRIRAATRKVATPSLLLPLLKTPRSSSRRFSFQRSASERHPEFISVSAACVVQVHACADEWPARRSALMLAGAGLHYRNFI